MINSLRHPFLLTQRTQSYNRGSGCVASLKTGVTTLRSALRDGTTKSNLFLVALTEMLYILTSLSTHTTSTSQNNPLAE